MDKHNDFLQSEEWRKFQESVGRKTHAIAGDYFSASIIEHRLPVAGKYFYIPRGPILVDSSQSAAHGLTDLINLAKKEKAGWIRFDANNSHALALIRSNWRVIKAPHDMQPKEIFVMDITKSEENLLADMKEKTRYNIRLAEKKGVSLRITNPYENTNSNDVDEFLRLVRKTSERQGITPHPEEYYRKMFEIIPGEILKLYVAEYEGPASTRGNVMSTRGGKVIAANLVVFYGDTTTYLHGASDNEYRNVMAPYLLQWRAIQDAKKVGITKYDFGGVKAGIMNNELGIRNDWSGITKFKLGFSPNTQPVKFLGSYDIIINPFKYNLYRFLQKIKNLI